MLTLSLAIMLSATGGAQTTHQSIDAIAGHEVVAIDVLLQPDAAMAQRARVLNERLRQGYPQGFALDATHVPHISLLHRFVRAQDLDKVRAAVAGVAAHQPVAQWSLTPSGYDVSPWQGRKMLSIALGRTAGLVSLQRELLDAIAPYAVETGDAAAFVTTADAPDIDAATIEYVRSFVPKRTGENFKPHITLGLATDAQARRLQSEKFDSAAFRTDGIAIYQLGNQGTARKRL